MFNLFKRNTENETLKQSEHYPVDVPAEQLKPEDINFHGLSYCPFCNESLEYGQFSHVCTRFRVWRG